MPTPAETLVLRTKLQQAEAAYHNLMCGTSARVVIDSSGEKVEFTSANAGKLTSYIQDLKRQLGLLSGSGPMRVWM